MKTIIEISKDLLQLQEILNSLEGLPQVQVAELHEWFAELSSDERQEERDRKLDNYVALITELEARSEARQIEAQRLAKRARTDANRAKLLKHMLQQFLESQHLTTLETERYQLNLVENQEELGIIVDETFPVSKMPDDLCKIERSPNLEAIRQRLKTGEEIPFAQFSDRRQSLKIQ